MSHKPQAVFRVCLVHLHLSDKQKTIIKSRNHYKETQNYNVTPNDCIETQNSHGNTQQLHKGTKLQEPKCPERHEKQLQQVAKQL